MSFFGSFLCVNTCMRASCHHRRLMKLTDGNFPFFFFFSISPFSREVIFYTQSLSTSLLTCFHFSFYSQLLIVACKFLNYVTVSLESVLLQTSVFGTYTALRTTLPCFTLFHKWEWHKSHFVATKWTKSS